MRLKLGATPAAPCTSIRTEITSVAMNPPCTPFDTSSIRTLPDMTRADSILLLLRHSITKLRLYIAVQQAADLSSAMRVNARGKFQESVRAIHYDRPAACCAAIYN